jgi:hypothetical protein
MMVVSTTADPELQVSQPELLFEGRYYPGLTYGRNYDIAPDGQRFLMIKEGEPPPPSVQINVVLNWSKKLQKLAPENE